MKQGEDDWQGDGPPSPDLGLAGLWTGLAIAGISFWAAIWFWSPAALATMCAGLIGAGIGYRHIRN